MTMVKYSERFFDEQLLFVNVAVDCEPFMAGHGYKCGDSEKIANFAKFIARLFKTIVKTLIL